MPKTIISNIKRMVTDEDTCVYIIQTSHNLLKMNQFTKKEPRQKSRLRLMKNSSDIKNCFECENYRNW